MARIKAPVVITANDLLTGEVVYLDPSRRWSPELSAAKVFNALDEAEGELAAAFSEAAVVGAYLAEVSNDVAVTPRHYRECFRHKGPSNYFHGKQAVQDAEVAA
ncbi:MAG: DUF2849 domain-containing protein [Pseudomonadota bacterium]|nr:DUF2849 domain-containing protein [Pseudomonadota bacterium]MEC7993555.1 DUF2849 domain-containing protein [Pseudomonadota bacterium]